MSKFGWDLPPGCRLSDIPGNRPEDEYYEHLADEVYAIFPDCTDEDMERLFKLFDQASKDGYETAVSNAAEDAAYDKDNMVRMTLELTETNEKLTKENSELKRWIADVKPILARGG